MTFRTSRLLGAACLAVLALAACQPAGLAPVAPALQAAAGDLVLDSGEGGGATVAVALAAQGATGRRLMAPSTPTAPFLTNQIATTELTLRRLDGPDAGVRQTGSIAGDPSGKTVTLSNLRPSASYRLEFVAKGSWGGVISAADQKVSFTLDAQGVADLAGPATIKLQDLVKPSTVYTMPGFDVVEGGTPLKGFVTAFCDLATAPGGLAVAADGSVYVATAGGAERWLADGTRDDQFTVTGLSGATDVALDPTGAYLYIADAGNDRIVRVSPGGGAATAFGASLESPASLAFGPDRQLYASTQGRVVRFDKDGQLATFLSAETIGEAKATTIISGATDDAALEHNRTRIALAAASVVAGGIAFDAKGDLYLAERGYKGLWKVTPAGVATNMRSPSFTPIDITPGDDGRSFITATDKKVYTMDFADAPVVFVGGGAAGSVEAAGTAAGFAGLAGIARDADGFVYVAETGAAPRIRKVL